MLELYHSINSVCAQKVRIALKETGIEAEERLMTLAGNQFDPAYIKLNPNAVVPTLIHEGAPIVEFSVILYYLDEAFAKTPIPKRADYKRDVHALGLYSANVAAPAKQHERLLDWIEESKGAAAYLAGEI